MTLAVVADGDPRNPKTNSGVAAGLIRGLSQSWPDLTVIPIDGKLSKRSTVEALPMAMMRSRRLRSELLFGSTGISARSRQRDRSIARSGEVSHILHVRNVYLPPATEYSAFIDSTTAVALAQWSKWAEVIGDPTARLAAESEFYSNATMVFSAGARAAESVVSDYKVPANRVHVVGGGVKFDPLPPMRARALSAGALRLLFIGTEFERKGGDLLIRAAEGARSQGLNVELDIVGPSAEPACPAWLRYHGRVTDDLRLREIYDRADVFCLPARHEPFGLVVIEALAHGLPCIVSDVGSLPEIVDGESGIVVPNGDVNLLREAMVDIGTDGTRYSRATRAAYERARYFTWQKVASRILDAFEIAKVSLI